MVMNMQIHLIVKEQTILEYPIKWLVLNHRLITAGRYTKLPTLSSGINDFKIISMLQGHFYLNIKIELLFGSSEYTKRRVVCETVLWTTMDDLYCWRRYISLFIFFSYCIVFSSFSSHIKTLMYCVKALI